MATKKQRDFLKSVLPEKFYIRKEMGEEQVYHKKYFKYMFRDWDYSFERLGELNQVIERLQAV